MNVLGLPEELLEAVLQHVKDTGTPGDFWNSMKTCQDFHRIGIGIHGRLDHSVSAILESDSRRQHLEQERCGTHLHHLTNFSLDNPSRYYISELRSFTVHIYHARIAAPFVPIPATNMFDSIVDVFGMTRRLSTFSLKFAGDGWDFPHNDVPAIPESQFARLVQHLPATVVNLEIDTAGVDIPPSFDLISTDPTKHLCFQIGKIMARLKHLRLRVGHVCEDLLGCITRISPFSGNSDCSCSVSDSGEPPWRKLRSLAIWLPEKLDDESNSIRGTLSSLSMLPPSPGPTINVISQSSPASFQAERANTECFYPSFTWEAQSNCPTTTRDESQVRVHRMHKFRPAMAGASDLPHCHEHELLATSLQRQFQVGGDVYPKSPYPEIAEWILEGSRRWAQDGHKGPRYPASEWQPLRVSKEVKDRNLEHGVGSYACLFPGCRVRCESLNHLRGHQLIKHPSQPHVEGHHDTIPCPSVGCDRIGSRALLYEQLESHLLSHHRTPCTHTYRPVLWAEDSCKTRVRFY